MPSSLSSSPPPRSRLQLWLRWVWLGVGVLVLVLLVWAVVFMIHESAGGGGPAGADSARSGSVRSVEPLRYDPPERVGGSATRIVQIRRGSGYRYSSRALSSAAASAVSGEGPAVNVIFLSGDSARLLLNRPAYIRDVSYPGARDVAEGDSLRWVVYEMAVDDADRNGVVDESDPLSLYVTDLEGRGLRRVLPPGYELRGWASQPGGTLVVTAVRLTSGGRAMPERAFVVDAAGAVRPYAALDSAVDAAARIVAKP
ncbi:MAG TPA: hypothetical protein VFJ16_05995 [Longimicrobium sp.]|nr:hypothetical protein [Longimicrobium sp.]